MLLCFVVELLLYGSTAEAEEVTQSGDNARFYRILIHSAKHGNTGGVCVQNRTLKTKTMCSLPLM